MQIRRLVLAASTSVLLLVPAAHAESNNYIIYANGDCSFRWWGDDTQFFADPGRARTARGFEEWGVDGRRDCQTPLELPIPTNGIGY